MRQIHEVHPGVPAFEWLAGGPKVRPTARALLLNDDGAALLMESRDFVGGPSYLHVVGGRIEPGENPEQAVVREVLEETGFTLAPGDLVGPLDQLEVTFEFPDAVPAVTYIQTERYYAAVVRAGAARLATALSDLEQQLGNTGRWMTRAQVREYAQVRARDGGNEPAFFPANLFDLWDAALAALSDKAHSPSP